MESVREDEINEIIKRAIEEYDKKQKIKFTQKIFRNTKLLMSNYNDFKNHINYSISDIRDLKEVIELEEEGYDDLFIMSIKQSKAKTLIMTAHIDKSLELLKISQDKEGTNEKYEALELYYIKNRSYVSIAKELHTSEITIKRWVKQMLEQLGILLFGIDGLKL
ncbi:helix-turn-helix domain-containing protein [Clostridium butyricum]|uniref:helix-turn-helix domain-containing protein n=1 Tax=Clostridium butyricum TaxID=1492 RepID=UPI003D358CD1